MGAVPRVPRGDVLLRPVQHVREGVVIGPLGPDGEEVLNRPASEQHGLGLGRRSTGTGALDRIGVRQHPTAVLEAAAAVLLGPARRLHDSVEGQADEGNDVHMRVLLVWSRRRLLILYTNDLRDIDTDSAVGVGGRSSATTAPARCAVRKVRSARDKLTNGTSRPPSTASAGLSRDKGAVDRRLPPHVARQALSGGRSH